MQPVEISDGNLRYKRVSKPIAKRIYKKGLPIILCPVKLHPFGPWRPSCMVQKEQFTEWPFERRVMDFEFYNCNCGEVGAYAAFYVQVTFLEELK